MNSENHIDFSEEPGRPEETEKKLPFVDGSWEFASDKLVENNLKISDQIIALIDKVEDNWVIKQKIIINSGEISIDADLLAMVISEAYADAAKYGNKSSPNSKVKINFHYDKDLIKAEVSDESPEEFDWQTELKKAKQRLSSEINETAGSGRGLVLMDQFFPGFKYEFMNPGNKAILSIQRPKSEQ